MTRFRFFKECKICGEKGESSLIKDHIIKNHDNVTSPEVYMEITDFDCPCCGEERIHEHSHCPSCGIDTFNVKYEEYKNPTELVNQVILMGWSITAKDIKVKWSYNKHKEYYDYNVTWHRTDVDNPDKLMELPYCLSGLIEEKIIKKLDKKVKSKENGWKEVTLDKFLKELNKQYITNN